MDLDHPLVGGPCWVNLATAEVAGAAVFYGEIFDWQTVIDPRPQAHGSALASLDGLPVAGLTPLLSPRQPTAWTMSLLVADVQETIETVRAEGGRLILPATDSLGEGKYAQVVDSTGAIFELWEATQRGGAPVLNQPGSLCWVELASRDLEAAGQFYERVFDWTVRDDVDNEMPYRRFGLDGKEFGGVMDMATLYPPEVPPHWMMYFATDDVDATVELTLKLGGAELVSPRDVAGEGRIAMVTDPYGAAFSLFTKG